METTQSPFIFISIPRNASSTVHSILGLVEPKDMSSGADWGLMDMHAPADMVRRRYGSEEFDRRYKFSFVRNPWDRCVSWYCHHAKLPPYSQYSFSDWVMAGMPHHWDIQNGTIYQRRRSPLEQLRFISDQDGNQMMDFVGRIERFEQDLADVAETLGVKLPDKVGRLNAARSRVSDDYRTYYNDQTAEIVGKDLAGDVQMFNYTF